jgi:predicted PurR-regulated permease PerM
MARWLAVLVTMLGAALTTVTVWAAVLVNLHDGFRTLSSQAPIAAASLERRYRVARRFNLVARVNSLIAQFRQPSTSATVGHAVGAAGTYFVCGILTLFLLIYGPRMWRGALAQIGTGERRQRFEDVAGRAALNARRYILWSLAQAVVASGVIGLAAWALSLPAPFVLGALVGTIGLVPVLGMVVGGLPALLVAAGLNGWRDVVIVAALVLVLQVVEIVLVRPRVDRATVHVGPALPAIVALIGYQVYGIGGAFYGAAGLVFVVAYLDAAGIEGEPSAPGAPHRGVSDPSTAVDASERTPGDPR